MLSIFAITEYIPTVQNIIQSEHRLEELVAVWDKTKNKPTTSSSTLVIDERGIVSAIDWVNERPPYLLPILPFEKNTLLGLIFHLLENNEKAWEYLSGFPEIAKEVSLNIRLQFNYQISTREFANPPIQTEFDRYRISHNKAILQHYGFIEEPIGVETVIEAYQDTLKAAKQKEYFAFSVVHFAALLLDANQLNQAEQLLKSTLSQRISEETQYSLKTVLTQVWMKQLTVPYNTELLEKLKHTLWETVQFFEKHNRKAEAGLQYLDAAHIANISESFAEALGYINKAILFFEEEELQELSGKAQLQKGTLLYTWSQQGNPQFYTPAVQAYQAALKVFRKEVVPDVFAEIHHNLAILYAEMPAESKKRSIWAGVSTASFQEALNYFTKEKHPYEYGRICNNYGNALTKFPLALHSDNYQKALFYYQEALDVRTPKHPYERAITMLNFLEASWNASNSLKGFNERRYQDMLAKAKEVLQLVDKPDMVNEAKKHLELLEELRKTVSETSNL